jgi:hypothetical protein
LSRPFFRPKFTTWGKKKKKKTTFGKEIIGTQLAMTQYQKMKFTHAQINYTQRDVVQEY